MRRSCAFFALIVLVSTVAATADPPLVDGVSGAPLAWSEWLPRKGPVALLVWASWAPESDRAVADFEKLDEACSKAGLNLVLLDVQEPLEDGRAALVSSGASWIHDRYGALLKQYRVFKIPSLLLLSADNTVLGRIESTPEAVRAWGGS
jgi:hypothetical protein